MLSRLSGMLASETRPLHFTDFQTEISSLVSFVLHPGDRLRNPPASLRAACFQRMHGAVGSVDGG
jgi:hypothetical protein